MSLFQPLLQLHSTTDIYTVLQRRQLFPAALVSPPREAVLVAALAAVLWGQHGDQLLTYADLWRDLRPLLASREHQLQSAILCLEHFGLGAVPRSPRVAALVAHPTGAGTAPAAADGWYCTYGPCIESPVASLHRVCLIP